MEREREKEIQSQRLVLQSADIQPQQERLQSIHDKLDHLVGIYAASVGKEMEYLEKLAKVE